MTGTIVFIKTTDIEDILWKEYPETVLLLGAPGVGKSMSVRYFAMSKARSLGLDFFELTKENINDIERRLEKGIDGEQLYNELQNKFVYKDLRLSEIAPEDLSGIPKAGEYVASYKPLTWLKIFSIAKHGVLFIDEITNVVRQDILSAVYKVLLDKMAGEIKFSDGIMVIGAGNYPRNVGGAEVPYGVSSTGLMFLPTAMIRRFRIFFVEPPSIDDWYEFVREEILVESEKYSKLGENYDVDFSNTFANIVYTFLKNKMNMFIKLPERETYIGYPNPASWSRLCIESNKFKDELMYITELIKIEEIIQRLKAEKKNTDIISISDIVVDTINDLIKGKESHIQKVMSILQSYIGPEASSDFIVFYMISGFGTDIDNITKEIFELFPDNIIGYGATNTSVVLNYAINNFILFALQRIVAALRNKGLLTEDEINRSMKYMNTKLVETIAYYLYCKGYGSVIKRVTEFLYGTMRTSLEVIQGALKVLEVPEYNKLGIIISSKMLRTVNNEPVFIRTGNVNKQIKQIAKSWAINYSNKNPFADCKGFKKTNETIVDVIE